MAGDSVASPFSTQSEVSLRTNTPFTRVAWLPLVLRSESIPTPTHTVVLLGPSSAQVTSSSNPALWIQRLGNSDFVRFEVNNEPRLVVDMNGNLAGRSLSMKETSTVEVNATQPALMIGQHGIGPALVISNTHDDSLGLYVPVLSKSPAIFIDDLYSPNISSTSPLFVHDMIDINNRGGGDGVYVVNSSWGAAFNFDNYADGRGLFGYNRTVGDGINIYNMGTGHGIYVFNEGEGIGLRSHNLGTGPAIMATGASPAPMLSVEQWGSGPLMVLHNTNVPVFTVNKSGGVIMAGTLNATNGIHLWNTLESMRPDGSIYLNYLGDRGVVDLYNGAVQFDPMGNVSSAGWMTATGINVRGTMTQPGIVLDSSGNITSAGNLTLQSPGTRPASLVLSGAQSQTSAIELDTNGNLTMTGKLSVVGASVGSSAFVSGTMVVTVTSLSVLTSSKILLTPTAPPSGLWHVAAKLPGVGFVVISQQPEPGTSFDYWIIN